MELANTSSSLWPYSFDVLGRWDRCHAEYLSAFLDIRRVCTPYPIPADSMSAVARRSWKRDRTRPGQRIGTGSGVRRQERTGRRRFARREREREAHSVVAKEALTAAQDDGIDHQA